MKRFRHLAVYYRDAKKVMRKIPDVYLFIDGNNLVKVYTLSPISGQQIILEEQK